MAQGAFRERRDFHDTIDVAASDILHVNPAVVEKDYWVTQALRALVPQFNEDFVFKGGTSLSKAFGIIHRFSEDLDLLVLRNGRGKGTLDNVMKAMGAAAGAAVGDDSPSHQNQDKGIKRTILLTYPRTRDEAWIRPTIDLEVGIRGGPNPHSSRSIRPLLSEALAAREVAIEEYADLSAFEIPVLHPGRTCVEKLALVNELAERCASDPDIVFPVRQGRHFYDIYMLLANEEVSIFLRDRETFTAVVEDSERVSHEHFRSDYTRPEAGYAAGKAFEGDEALDEQLRRAHEAAKDLAFDTTTYPSWEDVVARVRECRDML